MPLSSRTRSTPSTRPIVSRSPSTTSRPPASPPAGAAILSRGILALLAEPDRRGGPAGPPEHSPGTDGRRFYAAPGASVTTFRAASHSREPKTPRLRHFGAEVALPTESEGLELPRQSRQDDDQTDHQDDRDAEDDERHLPLPLDEVLEPQPLLVLTAPELGDQAVLRPLRAVDESAHRLGDRLDRGFDRGRRLRLLHDPRSEAVDRARDQVELLGGLLRHLVLLVHRG